MKFEKIIIPFLDKDKIKEQADWFRNNYWNSVLPINVEKIIELKLNMGIIPVSGLFELCDTDAFITANWSNVSVDQDSFMDEKKQNRLRFSFAHEIGHFVLHKEIYDSFNIKEPADLYLFIENIQSEQYSRLEKQADIFANNFLVPRNVLKIEKEKIMTEFKKMPELRNFKEDSLRPYIADRLADFFGVSAQVVEIALGSL